ncbi:PREDICTED: uncharacterized protein LOC105624147 [Atta cephalotes]|uniref:PDEase domain-containing protein n=1 Tax=Atta cephalotes TaxID=12957 RepID=A0A158NTN6_ATTCE|nr:PREDICTED: uncharacterized protein LOC105624147 [Atta cephalotes]
MQCGLCAVVAGLFRRAMCIAGSRRGSGESCYQELATDMQERRHSQVEDAEIELIKASEIVKRVKNVQAEERRTGEVTVDSEEQNAVFVCISDSSLFRNSGTSTTLPEVRDGSATAEAAFRRLSDAEQILLESLDIDQYRPRHTGRFLTMHKRRRKKLTTRSLNQEPGILDDIFHGLVQNTSVLENHHWRSAIGCLLESGVSAQLPADVRPELQRHISSLILATDITRQQEFLTRFRDYLSNNALEMKREEDRHFILQIALKCADISNPCRPWDISRKWSYKVCEEFFRQGDYERRLNLPVTPLCDRHTTSIPKIQAGFFKHVVTPLYVEWHRFLGDGLSVSLMEYLKMNQKKWESLINQEITEEKETDISEFNEPEGIISSGEETAADEDSGSIDLLIPATYVQTARMPTLPGRVGLDRVGRRHSVPLSVSKSLHLPLTQPNRRESMPIEQAKVKNQFWKMEDQNLLGPSSLSLLSSKSNMSESNVSIVERPVSAENLLPETSIASITSSAEASRLNTVLQSNNQYSAQTKQLVRQQTFPPLQPSTRMRYMSATAEMSQCYIQTLLETDNSFSCSTYTKEKSCPSGRFCSHDPNSSRHQKKSSISPLSKELPMDISVKKQGSTLLDTTKQKHTVNPMRRHSIQTVRTDDSFSKHRYKRPSSAQDPDSTQMFYATLTGSYSDKNKCVPDMYIAECKSNLNCNTEFKYHDAKLTVQELQTTLLPKKDQSTSSTLSAYSAQESRRYSTSVTECKTITIDHAGRRYTTIPVSSELSTHKVFFIGSPPDSPPNHSVSSSSDSGSEPKRSIDDSSKEASVVIGNRKELDNVKEKNSKSSKFNSDAQMKENVDPRTNDDVAKASSRRGNQGWAKRRGSAPVGLLSKLDDFTSTNISTRVDHNCRRGSVPTDITKHQGGSCNRLTLGYRGDNFSDLRRSSLPQETALGNLLENVLTLTRERESISINNNNNNNNNSNRSNNNGISKFDSIVSGMLSPRRGSIPADISELRRDLFSRNNVNNKPRNRKKILRRRSSGGPEMFTCGSTDGNDNGTWLKWKRDIGKRDPVPEAFVKRRGSLPIEMVAVSHAGSTSARRSSLWRF